MVRLADRLRLYRNQGMRTRYQFEMLGFNFRMAAIRDLLDHARNCRVTQRQLGRCAGKCNLFCGKFGSQGFGSLIILVPYDEHGF